MDTGDHGYRAAVPRLSNQIEILRERMLRHVPAHVVAGFRIIAVTVQPGSLVQNLLFENGLEHDGARSGLFGFDDVTQRRSETRAAHNDRAGKFQTEILRCDAIHVRSFYPAFCGGSEHKTALLYSSRKRIRSSEYKSRRDAARSTGNCRGSARRENSASQAQCPSGSHAGRRACRRRCHP